jgi:hypothetical protein
VDWNYYCHSLFTALKGMAGATGLEPAASCVKDRRSYLLNYPRIPGLLNFGFERFIQTARMSA